MAPPWPPALLLMKRELLMTWRDSVLEPASVQMAFAGTDERRNYANSLLNLGRLDEARVAAGRVLELQPNFRYGKQFAGVNCAPALAASLGEALRSAGLPE